MSFFKLFCIIKLIYRLFGKKRGKTVNITHVTISNGSYCLVFHSLLYNVDLII